MLENLSFILGDISVTRQWLQREKFISNETRLNSMITPRKRPTPLETALLFDLDGTLLDSKEKLAIEVQRTLQTLGTDISLEEARTYESWEDLAARHGHKKDAFWAVFDAVRTPWDTYLKQHRAHLYEEVPHVLEVLSEKGYPMGIVTRGSVREANAKVCHVGLEHYFPVIEGTSSKREVAPSKIVEASRAFRRLANGRPLGAAYMIGDNEMDDVGTAYELREQLRPEGVVVESVYVNRNNKPCRKFRPDHELTDLGGLVNILEGDAHAR